jgi:hypothetical protein
MCVLALAVVAACKPAPTPDDYFGAKVVPPRGLDKIVPGMTAKDALAAQPAARVVRRGVLAIASGVKDVELLAITDDKPTPVVVRVVARVTQPFAGRLRGALADHWGKETAHDTWAGDAWRAIVRDDGTGALEIELWPAMTTAFWGPPGDPPLALAKVKPGMMKHQIEDVVPAEVARFGHFAEDKATVTFGGDARPGGLNEITVLLTPDHGRGVLLKAWGEGEVEPEDAGMTADFAARHLWFDAASGWRATLHAAKPGRITAGGLAHDDILAFSRFVPTATLLGDGAEVAALAASPFGKTIEELAVTYPGMDSNVLALPATELTEQTLAVFALDAKAKVESVRLDLHYTAKGRAGLATAFEHKWGAAKLGPDGGLVYHASAPYISARDDGQSWQLTVQPVAPH